MQIARPSPIDVAERNNLISPRYDSHPFTPRATGMHEVAGRTSLAKLVVTRKRGVRQQETLPTIGKQGSRTG